MTLQNTAPTTAPYGEEELYERTIEIARVAKVMKGGRRFSFRAIVVVGDRKGRVGLGVGKAKAVPDAVRKASERARRNMKPVNVYGTTIPHEVIGEVGGARVLLKPASPGTGVIAAGAVRAVLEAAGSRDVLTKSLGANTVINVVQATMQALEQLRDVSEVAKERGKPEQEVKPFWDRRRRGAHG